MTGDRAVVATGPALSDRGLAVAQVRDEARHRVVIGARLRARGIEAAPQHRHGRRIGRNRASPTGVSAPMFRPIALGLLLALVATCSSGPPPVTTAPVSTTVAPASSAPAGPVLPLVTVERRGGLCVNGPCESLVAVEADGRLHQVRPSDAVLGRVPPELLEALRIEIDQANFPLIESRRFTGQCPTAYDGQETIYAFTVAGGTAVERIATCDVAIDPNHPLFRAVEATLAVAR